MTLHISPADQMRDSPTRIDGARPDSISDDVGAPIDLDNSGLSDEERWLRDLDATIVDSCAEMRAGGGTAMDVAWSAIKAEHEAAAG